MAIDYYEILQISPSADLAEIKTAYRKLAHTYHPDKNPGNKTSLAYFELVKEAYETLSNPGKKEKYLQERWLSKANGTPFQSVVRTPEDILMQVLNTSEKVNRLDLYRMNKEGVKDELGNLLSEENIKILHEFGEISVNDAIIKELLQIINILPAADELVLLKRMLFINSSDTVTIKNREEALNSNLFWETWKPAFIILMVVLLCILIWGTSLKY